MIYYSAATYAILCSVLPVFLFLLGTFIVLIYFIKDISNDVKNLPKLKLKSQKPERKQLFLKIIRDFSTIRQLSAFRFFLSFSIYYFLSQFFLRFLSAFNGIIEFNIAILFVWSLLSICSLLLVVQIVLVEYFL